MDDLEKMKKIFNISKSVVTSYVSRQIVQLNLSIGNNGKWAKWLKKYGSKQRTWF